MHSYSIDNKSREIVIVIILVISMFISLGINKLFASEIYDIQVLIENSAFGDICKFINWMDVSPNVLGVIFWYTIITILYDRFGWKIFVRFHGIPDFNGLWCGNLESSYDKKAIEMKMTVKQTWNKISIHSDFPQTRSMSDSNVAAICVNEVQNKRLYFDYENSSYDIEKRSQTHYGFNILTLVNDDEMRGRYFNDRLNDNSDIRGGNRGEFCLTRKKYKL